MKTPLYLVIFSLIVALLSSCKDDFLETLPLASPSDATYWSSVNDATLWINYAYRSLPSPSDYALIGMSDDAVGAGDNIARGVHTPNDVDIKWDYTTIRHCLELMENIDKIPTLTQEERNIHTGQARFIISLRYFEMITLYRDIPFFEETTTIEESDAPKTDKSVILAYILEQLDRAIAELPLAWPDAEAGRATQGAALALKARVLLYNERWAEAAATAQQLIDLGMYELHPNFDELFLTSFNNQTKESILEHQFAEGLYTHDLWNTFGFSTIGGSSKSCPLPALINSFECTDGLPIDESPLYDPLDPWTHRDPRFHMSFIVPFEEIGGQPFDPVNNIADKNANRTYVYFRKYIADMDSQQRSLWSNWKIFRYAEVLLTYAEAQNEVAGPDARVYDAIDQIRARAGMPALDRVRYRTQETLREAIRNERRVELAGEMLRYYDIIRWRIAEEVLDDQTYTSMEVPGLLPLKVINNGTFDPSKHYVLPIPQFAIDNAKNLEQHPEWD